MVHASTGVFCPHRSPASMTFVAPADPPSLFKFVLVLSPACHLLFTVGTRIRGRPRAPSLIRVPSPTSSWGSTICHAMCYPHFTNLGPPLRLCYLVFAHIYSSQLPYARMSRSVLTPRFLPCTHACLHDARPVKRRSSLPSPSHPSAFFSKARLPIPLLY